MKILTALRFEPAVEKQYNIYTTQRDTLYIRYALMLFTLLYAIFSVTDYLLVPQHFEFFFVIRFMFVIPVFCTSILISYLPRYYLYKQNSLLISYIAGGIGIVVMLVHEPANVVYYGGLMLVLTSGYFMIHLHTVYSTVGGSIILLAYIIGSLFSKSDFVSFFAICLFLLAQNLIGSIGAYQLEKMRRHEFLIANQKDLEISTAQISTILALAKLAESRDTDTGEHIERVGELCFRLAEALPQHYFADTQTQYDFCNTIRYSSALHDIGKVGVQDAVLNKPGKLTPEEMTEMRQHVTIGYSTLSKLHEQYPNNLFVKLGIDITLYHHEWWDGTGYPHGISQQNIPLSARIMAIVDTYDALISKRPYKEPFSHEQSLKIIQAEAGTHLDPQLVELFLTLFDRNTNINVF